MKVGITDAVLPSSVAVSWSPRCNGAPQVLLLTVAIGVKPRTQHMEVIADGLVTFEGGVL